jgi:ABC-type antimicrobial peptide transport system permease subunit
MTPRQTFGLAVRIIGLLVMLFGVLYFISWAVVLIDPHSRPGVSPAWHYFLNAVVELLIGVYLLRGAPFLVRIAYPDERPNPHPGSDA